MYFLNITFLYCSNQGPARSTRGRGRRGQKKDSHQETGDLIIYIKYGTNINKDNTRLLLKKYSLQLKSSIFFNN